MVYYSRKFNDAIKKGHKKIKTKSMKQCSENQFLFDVSGMHWG